MRHVDEGTLHELLDGSLPPFERQRVEDHLTRCAECRARLQEARALVLETAGLVDALDAGLGGVRAASRRPIERPTRGRSISRPAYLSWAASVVLAVGVGAAVRTWVHPATPSALAVVPSAPPADRVSPKPSPPRIGATEGALRRIDGALRRETAPPVSKALADAGPALTRGTANVADSTQAPTAKLRTSSAEALPATLREPSATAGALLDRVDERDQPSAPHRITLEEAVARLGGTIRLIDGLQPIAVEQVAGLAIQGGRSGPDAVLVRYMDPSFGTVELTQQRMPDWERADTAGVMASSPTRTVVSPPASHVGKTAASRMLAAAPPTRTSISWQDIQGFQLTLTAAVPAESLSALRARVR